MILALRGYTLFPASMSLEDLSRRCTIGHLSFSQHNPTFAMNYVSELLYIFKVSWFGFGILEWALDRKCSGKTWYVIIFKGTVATDRWWLCGLIRDCASLFCTWQILHSGRWDLADANTRTLHIKPIYLYIYIYLAGTESNLINHAECWYSCTISNEERLSRIQISL